MINMTYSELFNSYITSQRFKEDCESIRMKEEEQRKAPDRKGERNKRKSPKEHIMSNRIR